MLPRGNRLPEKVIRSRQPDQPTDNTWVWIWFLFVLGTLIAAILLVVCVPARGMPDGRLSKTAILQVVAIPLDILLAIGVGIWLARTQHWRSDNPAVTGLLAVVLFLLGSATAVALVFLACVWVAKL
jgi:hypothetical protein